MRAATALSLVGVLVPVNAFPGTRWLFSEAMSDREAERLAHSYRATGYTVCVEQLALRAVELRVATTFNDALAEAGIEPNPKLDAPIPYVVRT